MQALRLYVFFVKQLFSKQFIGLYVLAVVGTAGLVFSGLDWQYLLLVMQYVPRSLLYTADLTGFVVPALLLLGLLVLFWVTKKLLYKIYLQAVTYAIVLGFTVSTSIKVFTGRTSPPHPRSGDMSQMVDNSHAFNFGFMREQVFGGWPSSHTTVAFALAVSLTLLLPARLYIRAGLFAVSLFIGVGVSFGWHWLSEFVAGACLGTVIGTVVGKYFQAKLS